MIGVILVGSGFETPEGAGLGGVGAPSLSTGEAEVGALVASGLRKLLEAAEVAVWAETAVMEPVAVGVQGVFGVVIADRNAVAGCQDAAGVVPGSAFHLDEVDIEGVGAVGEEGVGEFV